MNHRSIPVAATLFVFCAIMADTTTAAERDQIVDELLILELKVLSGSELRQEILVSEGKAFRVRTSRDNLSWVVEGDVEQIDDGIAFVNLRVGVYGPHGYSVYQKTPKLERKVDEFKGGGFGTNHLLVSNLWIRRGLDAIPVLIRQLSAEPERSAAAAYYLGELGAEAKPAVRSLQELAKSDNDQVKRAARQALDDIAESTRNNAK